MALSELAGVLLSAGHEATVRDLGHGKGRVISSSLALSELAGVLLRTTLLMDNSGARRTNPRTFSVVIAMVLFVSFCSN